MIVFYLCSILPSFFMGFSLYSRGSWFTEKVKSSISFAATALTIGSCIGIAIKYSWLHIFGIIACYILFAWLGAQTCSILYNRGRRG